MHRRVILTFPILAVVSKAFVSTQSIRGRHHELLPLIDAAEPARITNLDFESFDDELNPDKQNNEKVDSHWF